MGVQGVGRMEDEAEPNPIGPTLWRLFGYFLPGRIVKSSATICERKLPEETSSSGIYADGG